METLHSRSPQSAGSGPSAPSAGAVHKSPSPAFTRGASREGGPTPGVAGHRTPALCEQDPGADPERVRGISLFPSTRERLHEQLLAYLAAGLADHEIARRLGVRNCRARRLRREATGTTWTRRRPR